MSRRSRHNTAPPITLFSFQDIMTSVMGILVLVTLMMALDLVCSATVLQIESREADSGSSSADLSALRARERALRQQYDQSLRKAAQLADLSGDPQSRLKPLLARLAQTQQEVRDLEERIARLREAAQTQASASGGARPTQEQTVQLEQRLAQLRGEIESLQRNPRLVYIVQEGTTKRPLLLELSAKRTGLGSPSQSDSALWFDNPRDEDRLQVLLAVTKQYDVEREYMVVLLKPSGFGQYGKVVDSLRRQGFDVGTELIEEDQWILTPPR